jgi:hypothetical protein
LQIYNLSNKWVLVINKGVLVYILSSKSIIVYNLGFRHALAYKINLKAILIYSLNLIKWIGYKARDSIKFKGGKRFSGFNLFLDFFFSSFY